MAAFDALPRATTFKLTTEPVRRVLEALGRPQDRMPPVIHVAGTNGKGSTTAFMRAIAEAHGLKVHVDTSPHLIHVNERVRLAGELITDDALRGYAERVLEANNGGVLSFFEGMTCVAYLAFSEVPADLTLVEVGLGGRFDSTNIFDAPALSVITPIDYDHKDFLGRHICQIAWEKAGIIKSGAPAVSAVQQPEVLRTLKAEALYRGTSITSLSEVSTITADEYGVSLEVDGMTLKTVELGLDGGHQYDNAALAILALKRSGVVRLMTEKVAQGLRAVEWPARIQTLKPGPLTALLPGKTVMLDGGHNPHAAIAIRRAMERYAPIPAAFAMLKTKDVASYLREMKPVLAHLACVPMAGGHNGQDPAVLAEVARKLGISASVHESLDDGLARLAEEQSDRALICGSLYLAGDVLARNGETIK